MLEGERLGVFDSEGVVEAVIVTETVADAVLLAVLVGVTDSDGVPLGVRLVDGERVGV